MKPLTSLAACYCSVLTPSLVTEGLSLGAWIQTLMNAMREALHSPERKGGTTQDEGTESGGVISLIKKPEV